jgi:DNA-binding CsgD family transcriptional regulator
VDQPGLLGREAECQALDQLVTTVESGQSAVLVLRGEAGIGKSALLDFVTGRATGLRTVTAAGAESEIELAFGGLHQLCRPLLSGLPRLPEPQRRALETAFGLTEGGAPERFLVGLAALNLLADAAAERPLLCVIEDAQWLDRVSAQTIAFIARRLFAESIGLVLAVRETGAADEMAGLPQFELKGLRESDARALVERAMPGRIDVRIRDRIVAEAHGNPLALLELPKGASLTELAGGFGLPDAGGLSGRIEESFIGRIAELPPPTQRLLLLAAAEPVGDVLLLRRAAAAEGLEASAWPPAEAAGLLEVGTRVRFRHPLVRSAAYRSAGAEERQTAHRTLADATDPQADPDRRAWHRAGAAVGPDEDVAADLERSANRAQARGGAAAAAAFLTRAAELSPDSGHRAARALAAAQATFQAGAFEAALELGKVAKLNGLDELGLAQLTLLRGRIRALMWGQLNGAPFLLTAAKQLETLDHSLMLATYRETIYTVLTGAAVSSEISDAYLGAPRPPEPTRDMLLLDGVTRMTAEGYAAGAPLLHAAVTAYRVDGVTKEEGLGWLPLACRLAQDAWDFESWSALTERLLEIAREAADLPALAVALQHRIMNRAHAGDLSSVESHAAEGVTIGEAVGSDFWSHYARLFSGPWLGREDTTNQAVDAISTAMRGVVGHTKVTADMQWAVAVLRNGQGRFEEAYDAAKIASEHPEELGLSIPSMVEFVEAAVKAGHPAEAAEVAARIVDMTRATATDWGLGTAAGVRALVSDGSDAEALYAEAFQRLARTGASMVLARMRLLYGEWLRGQQRRMDAREQLRLAHRMFREMGAQAFAGRAGRELSATGEVVQPATPRRVELTAQEAQIARLAGDGLTNPEIGAQLFISPHTVEWHLRKVFAKLGIRSRKQLRATLPHTAIAYS